MLLKKVLPLSFFIFLLFLQSNVYANSAISIVGFSLGDGWALWTLFLFIAVIFIEGGFTWLVIAKKSGYSFLDALFQLFIVNLVTTVIGFGIVLYFSPYSDRGMYMPGFYPIIFSGADEFIGSFIFFMLLTIVIETLLLFRYYNKKHPQPVYKIIGTGIGMNIPSYFLLFFIACFNFNFKVTGLGAWAVKHNMHILQTMLENYAVDWEGIYSPDIESLYKDATDPEKNYWKNFEEYPCEDYFLIDALANKEIKSFLLDAVDNPKPCGIKYIPVKNKSGQITIYKIVGYDTKGNLIKDRYPVGKEFILSNQ